jgi:hypothetical protein
MKLEADRQDLRVNIGISSFRLLCLWWTVTEAVTALPKPDAP